LDLADQFLIIFVHSVSLNFDAAVRGYRFPELQLQKVPIT